MNESINIDRMVQALSKVPETQLRIITLANTLPRVNDTFEYNALQEISDEIFAAVRESELYGQETSRMVRNLQVLMEATPNV
jgi:hypothetical protein